MIGIGGVFQCEGEILEVHAAQQQTQGWHDHLGHQGRDDFAEGSADDDADRHVDHVALDGKGFELLHHAHVITSCSDCWHRAGLSDDKNIIAIQRSRVFPVWRQKNICLLKIS
jgi:hypothetical protein